MNILLSCVGRRKYLIDYFKQEVGPGNKIVGVDMSRTAPALASCDSWELVPSIYEEGYLDRILDICLRNSIDALISLNDLELPILGRGRHLFRDAGVELVVSSDSVIDICSDKYKTYLFCEDNLIPAPVSFVSLDRALAAISTGSVRYPLVVKPRWGSASFGLHIVNDEKELVRAYGSCHASLENSYLSRFAESVDDVIIQEFISGKEYGLDIFNDVLGRYKGVVCKEKLAMRAGETDKAMTVDSGRFESLATAIGRKLGHVGNMDCDFLERDGRLYLLELNPRFGGGYPFSHEAGANLVRALLLSLAGRSNDIEISYEFDRVFAKCDSIVSFYD